MSFLLSAIFYKKGDLKKYIKIILFFILINSYWLIPILTASKTNITPINADDLYAFETKSNFVNSFLSTALMYGFWREDAYAKPSFLLLMPLFFIFLYLIIHGSLYSKNENKRKFVILAIFSLFLAVGTAHFLTKDVFNWLFNNFPIMKGFREPNKFAALLVLSYSYLASFGLNEIKNKKVIILAILAPFIFTPYIFNNQQIVPIDYPKDYYEINALLNQDKSDFNVLFLPWHLYLDFRWIKNTDKRIANPSEIFFDKPVIKADNMELYPIYSHSTNPISLYIEKNLNSSADKLSLINIKYIINAKEFPQKLDDSVLIKETENLFLYKISQPSYEFMQSDDLETFQELEYKKISSLHYKINPKMRYIIFTKANNKHWQLGSQKPLEDYPVNIYLNQGNIDLRYNGFYLTLIGYLISLAALFIILIKKIYDKID